MNRFQEIDSASLCSLAGLYGNPIPTQFLAPIDCSKIPAWVYCSTVLYFWPHIEKLSWIGSSLDQAFIPESIELKIDGQAFLRTYGLAPRPPPFPLSHQ
jgi:hypothetical protein